MASKWKRYDALRPDELAACLESAPVAFWPLGLLEHHGWHLPIGFDGLKAEGICIRVAEGTGGVLLPTMWWGAGGGHGDFLWTHYQSEEACGQILATTTRQLIRFGFRAIVLLAGHYPWQGILEATLPPIEAAHPDVLLLWGTETTISRGAVEVPGDHAAREETSYGLALFPELVEMDALRAGRGDDAWPKGAPPPIAHRHPGVRFDPNDPLFAQMGEEAWLATAERGEQALGPLVAWLTETIRNHLG